MSKLCFGCMRQKQCSPICEFCGHDESKINLPHQLPVGTILQNQYLIGRVLGQGGFGITYMGWDQHLSIPVAIKEYYPGGVVQRHTQLGTNVVCANGEEPVLFQKHRDKFLKEARTLARLSDIPEIVQIKSFFSANDTAYIVMEYVDGITLKSHLKDLGRPLTEAEALEKMEPVLIALQKVHDQHLIHRDISPDNIMLPRSGGVKLIDFGTVRYVDASGVSKSTEAVLKPGFAPIEQYNTRGELGTWTDVYALCATFHYLLTGKVPADVHERLVTGNQLTLLRNRSGISRKLIETLEKGMKIMPAERIQTVEQLYRMLYQQKNNVHHHSKKSETKPSIKELPRQVKKEDPKSKKVQISSPAERKEPKATLLEKKQEVNELSSKKNSRKHLPVIYAVAAAAVIVCTLFLLKPNSAPTSPKVDSKEDITMPMTPSGQDEQYQDALAEMENGNYGLAMEMFLELGEYADSAYQAEQCRLAIGYEEAVLLAETGEHAKAGIAFAKLGDYQDAHERSLSEWNQSRDRDSIAIGWSYPYERVILGILTDGTVVSDGTNGHGQQDVSSWTDIVEVYTDGALSIGLRSDGTVSVTKYISMNNVVHGFNEGRSTLEKEIGQWSNIAELVPYSGGNGYLGICYDGTVVKTSTLSNYDFDVSIWKDIVYITYLETGTLWPHSYEPIGLKIDGTIAYHGDKYTFDPELWYDVMEIDVGNYGVVGFRIDGSVVVEEPLEEELIYEHSGRYTCDNWSGVVDICGVFRLKSDGTVDAPDSRCELVSDLTNIKAIFGNGYPLYCIKDDNTVLAVGYDNYNGSCNVEQWTDIVRIYPEGDITIGLKRDGSILIPQFLDMAAEKWTDIKVPAIS